MRRGAELCGPFPEQICERECVRKFRMVKAFARKVLHTTHVVSRSGSDVSLQPRRIDTKTYMYRKIIPTIRKQIHIGKE